jgi:two-component system, LytTR family, response regulator
MEIRCVIVDDEPLARELMRAMLSGIEGVQIVAEYGNGADAVAGIRSLRPNVAFLDIQMPEMNGFEVVDELAGSAEADGEGLPAFVFVTAYDQYAIRAFDVHALDYLLKPYDADRLGRAVERARASVARAARGGGGGQQLLDLLETLRERGRAQGWIPIREGDRTFLQKMDEIEWIEADAKLMRIHTQTRTYSMRETLRNLEERLDPVTFLRVSRSSIVNLNWIREIQPWFNGEFVIVMKSGAQVTTSRSHRDKLAKLIGRKS